MHPVLEACAQPQSVYLRGRLVPLQGLSVVIHSKPRPTLAARRGLEVPARLSEPPRALHLDLSLQALFVSPQQLAVDVELALDAQQQCLLAVERVEPRRLRRRDPPRAHLAGPPAQRALEQLPVRARAQRAANREAPMTVWGTGEQGRDFVHIDDCIEAMMRILDAVKDGSGVNIGSGRLLNFKQVAALFVQLEGYEAEIKPLIGKPVGVHSRYADISHMQEILNWTPAISVEEGFGRVLEAARQRKARGEA